MINAIHRHVFWFLFAVVVCQQAVTARGQITISGGNWSAGCTYTPCNPISVVAESIFFTWSGAVYYPGIPPMIGQISGTVNQQIDGNWGWAPNQFIGTSQTIPNGFVFELAVSPIEVSFLSSNALVQLELPSQSLALNPGSSGSSVIRGFAAPGNMGCNTNNLLDWMLKYTNNTASPLQMTGIPGQTQPLLLAPGAVLSLTNVVQGDSQNQINVSPLAQNGYQNSDFAILTNAGTGMGWGYSQGDTNINYLTNSFANGQMANQLALLNNTNGPIVWNNIPDGPAQDSTLRAGFSALDNSLNEIYAKSNTAAVAGAAGGVSNIWVQNWPSNFGQFSISNFFTNSISDTNGSGGGSNGLSLADLSNFVQTNQLDTSNKIGSVISKLNAATNAAAGLSASSISAHMGFPSDSSSLVDDSGSPAQSPLILVGGSRGQISYSFGSVNGMPEFPGLRSLLKWCVLVALFRMVWTNFMGNIRRMFFVTANSVDLGLWNSVGAGTAAAITVAGVIMGVACAFVAYMLPIVFGFGDSVVQNGGTNPMAVLAATWAWQFLSQYVPIAFLVSSVLVWVGYEMVTDAAALVALGVIKMLSAV